ncbi:MAG: hypothetical protein NC911_11245, partial [Candidatus Omnitrophica bacterium]|nr:hypothetical protein [Candidatus Omnitrophota bacterium]
ELFLSLFKSGQTELLNKILSLIRQGLSFTRMVEEAVDIYLNLFQQYPAYFSILFLEAPHLRLKLARQLQPQVTKILRTVQPCYHQAILQGKIKRVSLKEAIFLLSGLLQGAVFQWILSDRSYSLTSRAKTIKKIFLTGLAKT